LLAPTSELLAIGNTCQVEATLEGSTRYPSGCSLASLVLVSTAGGVTTGLAMSLVSVGMLDARILEMEGSDVQKKQTKLCAMLIISRRHFLLVTLLLMNVIANEALPVFLDKILCEGVAITIVSVTCVLLFGEIIPVTRHIAYPITALLQCCSRRRNVRPSEHTGGCMPARVRLYGIQYVAVVCCCPMW
jgi:hypothetical protein